MFPEYDLTQAFGPDYFIPKLQFYIELYLEDHDRRPGYVLELAKCSLNMTHRKLLVLSISSQKRNSDP